MKVPSTTPMLDQCKENLVTWRRQEMRRVLQYQSIRGFYLMLGKPSKKSSTFVGRLGGVRFFKASLSQGK